MIEELTDERWATINHNRETLTIKESEEHLDSFARRVAGLDFYLYANIMGFFQSLDSHYENEHSDQDISAYFDDPCNGDWEGQYY